MMSDTSHMADGVVVLGSCGAWPEAGRACSGFLVSYRGTRIVLDMGYGTAARLFSLVAVPDAVVITHAHPDHAVDLHALFRSLRYGPAPDPGGRVGGPVPVTAAEGGRPVPVTAAGDGRPVPVLAAAGVPELIAAMDPPDAASIPAFLDFRPLPAAPCAVGPFVLRSFPLPHYVPNVGVRLEAPGLCVAYTGDTGPSPSLVSLARDADLFIADCTDRPPLNLGPREAAEAAAAGGARRLLLTHFWPGADREAGRRAAAEAFDGEILLADEGLEISIP
jgi:ribonuclease BN (tRNA processing enzyme)